MLVWKGWIPLFCEKHSYFTSNRSFCFGALYCINCVWISPCRQLNSSTCTWRLIRSIQNHKYTSNDCSVWHFLPFILSIEFFSRDPLKRNTNVTEWAECSFFVSTTITERVWRFTLKYFFGLLIRILIMKKKFFPLYCLLYILDFIFFVCLA